MSRAPSIGARTNPDPAAVIGGRLPPGPALPWQPGPRRSRQRPRLLFGPKSALACETGPGGQGAENRLPGAKGTAGNAKGPAAGGPRPDRGAAAGGAMVSRHGCHSGKRLRTWRLPLVSRPRPPPSPHPRPSPPAPGVPTWRPKIRTLGWEPSLPSAGPRRAPVGVQPWTPSHFSLLYALASTPLPTLGLSSQGPG